MKQPSSVDTLRTRIDAFRMKGASREEIRAKQNRRLQDLLEFVVRESRFYKHRYADVERPITDLRSLPPVTKSQLMEHFDSVVTDTAVEFADVEAFTSDTATIGQRFLGRYPVWLTSGTTGEPGTFLQDDWALLATDSVGDRWSVPAFVDRETISRLVIDGEMAFPDVLASSSKPKIDQAGPNLRDSGSVSGVIPIEWNGDHHFLVRKDRSLRPTVLFESDDP